MRETRMRETHQGAAVLACHDVTKSYGGVLAVDSVTLEVPPRGLLGLCGFNGAGKSTLFDLLAGSVGPTRAAFGSTAGRHRGVRHAPGPLRRGADLADGAPRAGADGLDNVAAACLRDPGQSMLASLWRSQAAPARERAWPPWRSRHRSPRRAARRRADPRGAAADGAGPGARQRAPVLLADEPASGLSATQRSVWPRPSSRSARSRPSSSSSTTSTCPRPSAVTCGRWWRGGWRTRATCRPSAPRRCTRPARHTAGVTPAPLLTSIRMITTDDFHQP